MPVRRYRAGDSQGLWHIRLAGFGGYGPQGIETFRASKVQGCLGFKVGFMLDHVVNVVVNPTAGFLTP